MKIQINVDGMHCNSCSDRIEDALMGKVNYVNANFSKGIVKVDFDSNRISSNRIKDIINGIGYEVKNVGGGDNVIARKENVKEGIMRKGENGNRQEKDNVREENIREKTKGVIEREERERRGKENGKEEKRERKCEVNEEKYGEKKKTDVVGLVVMLVSVVVVLYLIYNYVGNFNLNVPGAGDNASLLLLFFVGILTGFHCVSMCGAFVVSYTTKNAINGHKGYAQHFIYGGSKVISYAVIGGIFGLIGGIFSFSVGLRGAIGIFAGVFMIFYGLSMMGFKFFRRFQFNPKFLTTFTRHASKNANGPYYGPFITGILSGLFIACGPLQAMYLYAMGSGSFFNGFTSLMAFGLGTLPVMLIFGTMATRISRDTTNKILKVSAIIVLILGIIVLNRGLTVIGSPVTYESIRDKIIPHEVGSAVIKGEYQEINMEVNKYGWSPDTFTLKKGVPVKWNIDVKELTGCNREILVKDYGLDIKLKAGLNVIEFTPDKAGAVRWSCWMGMIPGSFIVTDSGEATQQEIASSAPVASGTCGGGNGGACGCGG